MERAPLLDVGHDGISDFHWHLHRRSTVLERLGKTNILPCCETFDGFQHRFTSSHVQSHGASDIETLKEHVCLPALWVVASSWTRATSGSGGGFASLATCNVEKKGSDVCLGNSWCQWLTPAFLFLLFHRRWTAAPAHKLEVGFRVKVRRGYPIPPSRTRPTRCAPIAGMGHAESLLVNCEMSICEVVLSLTTPPPPPPPPARPP